jgi:hypothetical protein
MPSAFSEQQFGVSVALISLFRGVDSAVFIKGIVKDFQENLALSLFYLPRL